MNETFILLVIEEKEQELSCIQDALEKLRFKGVEFSIMHARTLEEAVELLTKENDFDLILTDLYLPDSSGLDTIRKIGDASSDIPIIATSATTDEEMIRQIIRLGAQDYLPKEELDPSHLHRVIYASIERNKLQLSLKALSFTDEMTGLYNRRGFFTLLEQQIQLAKRTGQGFFLFIIDLDFLKIINDQYGHPAGDKALMDIADCLQLSFRHHDIVGRVGGDEFAVIAINAVENSEEQIKRKIEYKIEEQNARTHEPYRLSISMGAAYYNQRDNPTIEELVIKADQALYKSKKEAHSRGVGPPREQMGEPD